MEDETPKPEEPAVPDSPEGGKTLDDLTVVGVGTSAGGSVNCFV